MFDSFVSTFILLTIVDIYSVPNLLYASKPCLIVYDDLNTTRLFVIPGRRNKEYTLQFALIHGILEISLGDGGLFLLENRAVS